MDGVDRMKSSVYRLKLFKFSGQNEKKGSGKNRMPFKIRILYTHLLLGIINANKMILRNYKTWNCIIFICQYGFERLQNAFQCH